MLQRKNLRGLQRGRPVMVFPGGCVVPHVRSI
jgi:hypothetical protein